MLLNLLAFALAATTPIKSVEIPVPEKYQKAATVKLVLVDSYEELEKFCGKQPKGYTVHGCVDKIGGNTIYTKNPCQRSSERRDKRSYANIVCHELGHINGWSHGP